MMIDVPFNLPFVGNLTDVNGEKIEVKAHLSVDSDYVARVQMEGTLVAPQRPYHTMFKSPGIVESRLEDGRLLELDPVVLRLTYAGHRVHGLLFPNKARLVVPDPEKDSEISGSLRLSWLLSSAGLLEETARRDPVFLGSHLELIDPTSISARRKKQRHPLHWTLDEDTTAEIVMLEQERSSSFNAYAHEEFRIVARPVLSITSKVSLLDQAGVRSRIMELESWAQDALQCVGFIAGHSISWLSRTVEVQRATARFRFVEQELRFGVPHNNVADRKRAMLLSGQFYSDFPSRVSSYRQGKAHLESALHSYLLSRQSLMGAPMAAFLLITTALETLKDLYQTETKGGWLVEATKFKKSIQPEFEKTIEHLEDIEEYTQKSMKQKVMELNRPAYREMVQKMCQGWGVAYDDLYPKDLSFIQIRNNLVHAGKSPDHDTLLLETKKLTALVERLVVKKLGFSIQSGSILGEL